MANMNMELSDDMMNEAVGGKIGDLGHPVFTLGQIVDVRFANDEGVITTLSGPIIGIVASPVCWWYTVELQSNGNVHKVKLPEDALLKDNPPIG